MKVAIILLSLLFLGFSFNLKSPETCTWKNTCPVSGGSYPVCGLTAEQMITPGVWHVTVCVSESPWVGGASVDVRTTVSGKITDIKTHADTHCGSPSGKGTNAFYAHCGCNGSCSLTGSWEVIFTK